MVVAKKTLYTHRSRGLGMGYFPVLHPTRVLDLLHRKQFLHAFSLRPCCSMTPYSMFCSALTVLGPPSTSTVPPVFISWEAGKLQREATAVMSVAGLVVFIVSSKLRPECTYTDSSKLEVPPASGAAAIMPGGRSAVCRVPGVPNSYKAELVAMLTFLGRERKFAWIARVLSLQRSAKSARSGKRVGYRRSATPSPQKGNSQSGLKGTWAMSSTRPLINMRVLALPSPPPPCTALFSLGSCSAWRIHGSPPQSGDTRLGPKPYPPRLPPVVKEVTKIPPLSVAQKAFWSAESLRIRTLCDLLV